MEVSVNMWAVIIAAIAEFIVGAIWYMPLFGKQWGKIHGFDAHDKKTQEEMQRSMMPLLAVQFLMGLLIAYVLAHVIAAAPDESPYKLAFFMWLGFIVPTQVGAVIFGGTDGKWIGSKIAIMAGGALATVMVATLVLTLIK